MGETMKLLIGAAALAAAGLVSAAPAAAETYYALGMTYEEINVDNNPGIRNAGVPLVTALAGWKGDSWWGFESELSLGIGAGDPVSLTQNLNIRQSAGIYGTVHYPVTEALDLHARAGLVHQVSKLSNSGVATVVTEAGPSYGVGASYTINTELTVRFDYTMQDIDFDYGVGQSDGASSLQLTVVKTF